jgi:hypothetical protein
MTDQEVNKIIAEYMGWRRKGNHNKWFDENNKQRNFLSKYTTSLDALVPVWEKLGPRFKSVIYIGWLKKGSTGYADGVQVNNKYGHGETIQQAAARATAKAIQELK